MCHDIESVSDSNRIGWDQGFLLLFWVSNSIMRIIIHFVSWFLHILQLSLSSDYSFIRFIHQSRVLACVRRTRADDDDIFMWKILSSPSVLYGALYFQHENMEMIFYLTKRLYHGLLWFSQLIRLPTQTDHGAIIMTWSLFCIFSDCSTGSNEMILSQSHLINNSVQVLPLMAAAVRHLRLRLLSFRWILFGWLLELEDAKNSGIQEIRRLIWIVSSSSPLFVASIQDDSDSFHLIIMLSCILSSECLLELTADVSVFGSALRNRSQVISDWNSRIGKFSVSFLSFESNCSLHWWRCRFPSSNWFLDVLRFKSESWRRRRRVRLENFSLDSEKKSKSKEQTFRSKTNQRGEGWKKWLMSDEQPTWHTRHPNSRNQANSQSHVLMIRSWLGSSWWSNSICLFVRLTMNVM